MPRRAKIRPDEPGREKVLSAGLELFGERGYDATSIAEIGLRAGIAKSVLYHYFGSKAGLWEEVAVAQTRELVAAGAAAGPGDPGAPRPRVGGAGRGGRAAPARRRRRATRVPRRAHGSLAASAARRAHRPRASEDPQA